MDTFKSVPQQGAKVRDYTKATIVIDGVNALGEKFHFEVPPSPLPLPISKNTDGPLGKIVLQLEMPIL